MTRNLYILLICILACSMAFVLACSDDDDEVDGFDSGDDDDDDDSSGGDGSIGTNECGTYGDSGCDDSDDRACDSAFLANQDRYDFPEESDCAPNLKWSDDLAAVAYAHSKDMCERDFFAHDNPDGKSPFDRMEDDGISFVSAGENLAAGTNLSMETANDMWMDEPVCVHNHRSNLLSRLFTHIGVGVYDCGSMVYITQDFATFSFDDMPEGDHPQCGSNF